MGYDTVGRSATAAPPAHGNMRLHCSAGPLPLLKHGRAASSNLTNRAPYQQHTDDARAAWETCMRMQAGTPRTGACKSLAGIRTTGQQLRLALYLK